MIEQLDLYYDNDFKIIDNLRYYPQDWKNFNKLEKGEKVLIVAESVYNWADDNDIKAKKQHKK